MIFNSLFTRYILIFLFVSTTNAMDTKYEKPAIGWQRTPNKSTEDTNTQNIKKTTQEQETVVAKKSLPEESSEKKQSQEETIKTKSYYEQFKDFLTGSKKTPSPKATPIIPKSPEHAAAIQGAKTFVAAQKPELTQTQKSWTDMCSDLEKKLPQVPEGDVKTELSEELKESKQMLNDFRKAFNTQTTDDMNTAVTKLNGLLQTYDQKSQKALTDVQEDYKKLAEKTKELVAEMQKLIKQGELQKPEDTEESKGMRAFKPDEERQAKINKGTDLVATLVKSPERISDALPPKPREIEILLDPSAKLTTKELLNIQKSPKIQKYMTEYRTAIESIGEHFFNEAKKKAPDYSSGSIVIEDKNGKIHEFLRSYVEISRKLTSGQKTNVDKPCLIANGPAYARISSHFGNFFKYGSLEAAKAGRPTQYGIDLGTPIKTFTENVATDDIRHHMLFGKLSSDEPYIFMKFEARGLGSPKDAAIHSINYLKSVINKTKDTIQVKMAGQQIASSPKKPTDRFIIKDRKEHAPKAILAEYKKLLGKSNLSSDEQVEKLKEVKARGISAIWRQSNGNPEFQGIADKLRRSYGNDNLDIRVGNEVIIRDQELQGLKPDSAAY